VATTSPTEIARQAIAEAKELRAKAEQLEKELNQYQLLNTLNRLAVVETRVDQAEKMTPKSNVLGSLTTALTS
jgi:hypothetical protein